ncbi:LOW QUALITY PROTEIN: oxysterol-binding protein-related protein 2 [Hoplias malabaricus]|uniref:LOW QUALITY PROTEIN: oxysterol-binding protein-related protein 2 n=1 Tax=Hoplias malabaricus TaxID=27720 RepID=UPI0034625833
MDLSEEECSLCYGKHNPNGGWTALHLACYFGQKEIAEEMLKAGVEVNVQNDLGDTPLHLAALSGRKEAVLLLLRYDACATVINGAAQTPRAVTEDDEIITMLEAAERRERRKIEEKLLEAARKGDSVTMAEMKSNFLAWTSHWVVVENGSLSWYSKQSDAESSNSKQGSKPLMKAQCMMKAWDKYFFTLKCCDGSVHQFRLPFSCSEPEVMRKKWLDAIEGHSAYSAHSAKPENLEEKHAAEEDIAPRDLSHSLQTAESSQQKLESQVALLVSMVKSDDDNKSAGHELLKVREICQLCRETSSAMRHCLNLLSTQEEVWSVKLEQEVEKNKILSQALQALVTERQRLKQVLANGKKSPTPSTLTEDEFFDALTEWFSVSCVISFLSERGHTVSIKAAGPFAQLQPPSKPTRVLLSCLGMVTMVTRPTITVKKHRKSLPAPMFSRNDVSIWSILKKCIGMELSKIAMPVIFNEPLSFLQRLTEYMEHTYLIHQANVSTDSIHRMKCVAAFAVSAVASQWERTGKPFNPLLGETYELIREDLGFRWVSEQVSHHPPISAFHAEGLKEDFLFHGSIYPKLKFWGKSVEAEPRGIITLELPKHNEAYTWTNPTCCVHNIIVGQLWIEQYGNVEVINHKTGERCSLTFKPCGLFGKELHKVEGYILDKSKKKICAIYGKWTECLYTVDPATFDLHKKADKKPTEEKKGNKQSSVDEEPEEMPPPEAETVQVIPGSELIWRISPRPDNSTQYYAFSTFAMQLNELEEDIKEKLPTTDCRLRPDIRALENGDIDSASAEKKRLEEKQRMARKNRSKSSEDWKTRWFHQGPNPHNGGQDWIYSGGYWNRNYSQLPDIY